MPSLVLWWFQFSHLSSSTNTDKISSVPPQFDGQGLRNVYMERVSRRWWISDGVRYRYIRTRCLKNQRIC
jgi:hypothetical protein